MCEHRHDDKDRERRAEREDERRVGDRERIGAHQQRTGDGERVQRRTALIDGATPDRVLTGLLRRAAWG